MKKEDRRGERSEGGRQEERGVKEGDRRRGGVKEEDRRRGRESSTCVSNSCYWERQQPECVSVNVCVWWCVLMCVCVVCVLMCV